jgi:hypothetical protein
MSNWILGPINRRSAIWNTYPAQRTVVEASAEWEAREKAAETAPELAAPNPWLDANHTTCEEITPPEVLLSRRLGAGGRGLRSEPQP